MTFSKTSLLILAETRKNKKCKDPVPFVSCLRTDISLANVSQKVVSVKHGVPYHNLYLKKTTNTELTNYRNIKIGDVA